MNPNSKKVSLKIDTTFFLELQSYEKSNGPNWVLPFLSSFSFQESFHLSLKKKKKKKKKPKKIQKDIRKCIHTQRRCIWKIVYI